MIVWLASWAWAYDPPPFQASQHLYLDAASVRSEQSEVALVAADVPIYAVVTQRATDARHRGLPWGSEAEAALERTWESWSRDPAFPPGDAVVVLVAVEERAVQVKAGSTWDAEFGYHNDTLSAFTERYFVPKARAGDLDAALAETVRALSDAMAGARDMPMVLPNAVPTEHVTVVPPFPMLPRVATATLRVPDAAPVYLVVGQHMPPGERGAANRAKLAAELRPEGEDAVLVLWDVRADQLDVAVGPAWQGVGEGAQGWVDELSREGRDAEGRLTSARLVPALNNRYLHAQHMRTEAEMARRRVWSTPRPLEAPLKTWPPELQADWQDVSKRLRQSALRMQIVIVEQADRDLSVVGPDGRRWTERIADETVRDPRTGIVVVLDPPDVEVRGAVMIDTVRGPRDVALPTLLPEASTPQARVLAWFDRLDVAIADTQDQARREQEANERGAIVVALAGLAVVSFPVVGVVAWIVFGVVAARRRRLLLAIDAVVEDHHLLRARVLAARERLDDLRLDAEMRSQIRSLRDHGPHTGALYREVGALIDGLELGIRHLERRLEDIGDVRPRSWGEVDALRRSLDAPVQVEATADEAPDLFDLPPEPRTEPMAGFIEALNQRFRQAMHGLVRLQDARAAANRTVEADLASEPDPEVAELPQRLEAARLPAAWMLQHPATPETKAELDHLRKTDPVAYLDALAAVRGRVVDFERELDALLDTLEALSKERDRMLGALDPPTWSGELEDAEDPRHLAKSAVDVERSAWAAAREVGDLASAMAAARAARSAWKEVFGAEARARAAPTDARARLADASARIVATRSQVDDAKAQIDSLSRRIDGLEALGRRLDDARVDLAEGEVALSAAATLMEKKRFTQVIRACDRVLHETVEAAEDLAAVTLSIKEAADAREAAQEALFALAPDRQRYVDLLKSFGHGEELLADGDSLRAALESRMKGGRFRPNEVLSEAFLVRSAWRRRVKHLEEAQAQAEERRRQAREESERRRTSAYTTSGWSSSGSSSSSRSSSFGGSFGSSSFGSSSGRSGGSSFGSSSGRSGGSSFGSSSGRSGGSSFGSSSGRSGGSSFGSSSGRSGGSRW